MEPTVISSVPTAQIRSDRVGSIATDLMDGEGKWDSSVWKMVGRGRERRDDGRGDVSRFEGGRWVGRGGASALQLWAMHRATGAVCKRRSDCDSPRETRGKSAGRAGRTMRF